ncbi:hypothetical protein B0T13DRAFT_322871 [Neurospora crassa]|nr:hypothetical protein B0T13DRAFT_322871 [Neurospora crassa]
MVPCGHGFLSFSLWLPLSGSSLQGVSGPARSFSAAPGQADTRRRTGTRICDFTGLMEPEMQSTASPHPGSRPRPRHRVPLCTMPWSAGLARRRRVVAHLLFGDDKQTTKQAHARFSFFYLFFFLSFLFFPGIYGETVIRPIGLIDN